MENKAVVNSDLEHLADILVLQDEFLDPVHEEALHIEGGLHAVPERASSLKNFRVGDILVEAGLVSREQVERVLRDVLGDDGHHERHEGKRPKVGELLVKSGLITEEQLISALATKFGLRFVDLSNVTPSDAALAAIPQRLAVRLQVFPVSLDRRKLVVATSTPTDLTTESTLNFTTNCSIELVVSSARQIAAAIDKYYLRKGEAVDTLLETMKREGEAVAVEDDLEEERLLFHPDSKVVSLVNRLLVDAYQRGASDIHFEPGPGNEPLAIRYRIDGECLPAHSISSTYKWAVLARIKIMAQLDIAERRRPQSGKILLRYHHQKLEYRVEITPLVGGGRLRC